MKKKIRKQDFNNFWYNKTIPKKKFYSWYLFNIIVFSNPFIVSYWLKKIVLKLHGAKIGKRFIIKPGVKIKYPWNLECGNYVSIGEDVWIDNLEKVKLSDQVTISQGAYLFTGNHNYKKVSFDLIVKPIIVEYGVWIGAKTIICPGIKLNSHSIITAGSVLTKSTEPYTIYQGNPAIEIKKRILND